MWINFTETVVEVTTWGRSPASTTRDNKEPLNNYAAQIEVKRRQQREGTEPNKGTVRDPQYKPSRRERGRHEREGTGKEHKGEDGRAKEPATKKEKNGLVRKMSWMTGARKLTTEPSTCKDGTAEGSQKVDRRWSAFRTKQWRGRTRCRWSTNGRPFSHVNCKALERCANHGKRLRRVDKQVSRGVRGKRRGGEVSRWKNIRVKRLLCCGRTLLSLP